MIALRADANQTVATGHVMRCLSLAAALREAGEKPVFFTADEAGGQIVGQYGFQAVALGTDWRDMEGELPVLLSLLAKYDVRTIVVDSYQATAAYLKALGLQCKTAYMDDMDAFHAPVDVLINYNAYGPMWDYPARYADTKLLLGCAYAPLRAQFKGVPHRCRQRAENVLLTTGGGDACNAAYWIAHAMPGDLQCHIAAGRMQTHFPELMRLAKERNNITLHHDVEDMAALMRSCDIAVSAGGSTLYELCACGLPTVLFTVADNQLPAAQAFERLDLMICAGDFRGDGEACTARIMAGVEKYRHDFDLRNRRSRAMQGLVDGRGAERLARAIMEI